MTAVFLSHSSHDKKFVRKLADELRAYDVEVWLDEVELTIGQSLRAHIKQAIERTDYLVVVVSASSLTSRWVREEIRIAEEIGTKLGRLVLRPIVIDDMDEAAIEAALGDRLYADFRDDTLFLDATAQLLRSIGQISGVDTLVEEIDDLPNFRGHSNDVIGHGRLITREICYNSLMDVPLYRDWLLWELLQDQFVDGYPMEALVGIQAGHLACTIRDDWLGTKISLEIPVEKAREGVWECEPTVYGNVKVIDHDAPFVIADHFATRFGVPDGDNVAQNPTSIPVPEDLANLKRSALDQLRQAPREVAESVLWDLHMVTVGLIGRPITLFAGIIRYSPPGALKDAIFCSLQDRDESRDCEKSGEDILFVQIEDDFFMRTQAILLCPNHSHELWRAPINLIRHNSVNTELVLHDQS